MCETNTELYTELYRELYREWDARRVSLERRNRKEDGKKTEGKEEYTVNLISSSNATSNISCSSAINSIS